MVDLLILATGDLGHMRQCADDDLFYAFSDGRIDEYFALGNFSGSSVFVAEYRHGHRKCDAGTTHCSSERFVVIRICLDHLNSLALRGRADLVLF